MKTQKLIIIIVFIISPLITFNAFGRSINGETAYNNVIDKLRFEPKLDATAITVSIEGASDVVVLGGTVKTHAEKTIAEGAVKEIRGVRAVIDEMLVSSLAWRKIKTDHDIVTAAIQAFKWHALIPEELVKITVDNGHVTLSGRVDWQYQKNLAWNAVNNLLGVKSIKNNIIVKLVKAIQLDTKIIKSKITKEFERHARIDADKIKVEAKGNKIILTGEVRNFDEIDEAEEMAWSVPGVEEVVNDLIIEW